MLRSMFGLSASMYMSLCSWLKPVESDPVFMFPSMCLKLLRNLLKV